MVVVDDQLEVGLKQSELRIQEPPPWVLQLPAALVAAFEFC